MIPFFNVHGGHDSWSRGKSVQLLRDVREQVEGVVGVPCVHEIHRGRLTYSPWVRVSGAGRALPLTSPTAQNPSRVAARQ
jgi:hypothetical protein